MPFRIIKGKKLESNIKTNFENPNQAFAYTILYYCGLLQQLLACNVKSYVLKRWQAVCKTKLCPNWRLGYNFQTSRMRQERQ